MGTPPEDDEPMLKCKRCGKALRLDEDAIAAHASECVLVVKEKLETGLPKDSHALPPLPPLMVPPAWTVVDSIRPGAAKSGFLCLYRKRGWEWMHFELGGVHISCSRLDLPPPGDNKKDAATDTFEIEADATVVDGGDTRFCIEVIDRKFPVVLLLAAPSRTAKEQWIASMDTCKQEQERVQDVLDEGFEVEGSASGEKACSPGAKPKRSRVRQSGFLSVLNRPNKNSADPQWTRYYWTLEGYTLRKFQEVGGKPVGGHILPQSCTVLEAHAEYGKPLAFKLMDSTVRLLMVAWAM